MWKIVIAGVVFFSCSQFSLAQEGAEGSRRFDILLGISFGRRNEIEIVGFPYSESRMNIRPELGFAHERSGVFVNFGATKTTNPHDAVGDQVSVSVGWTGETKHWRLQTDLNRYDVDVTLTTVKRGMTVTLEGRERVHSLRFLIESKRRCGTPYVWLQEYGGTTAHIVGGSCETRRVTFAMEIGGNDGISHLPAEAFAFSRLKVESTPLKWLSGGRVGLVGQYARVFPFEDQVWATARWQWDVF